MHSHSHNRALHFALLWIALLVPAGLSAQTGEQHRDLVTIENIPSPNFGAVNTILRDRLGILWIGTTKGLCKYDGYGVRTFQVGSPGVGGSQQDVIALFQSDDTTLLLGTRKGPWRFDIRSGQSTPAFTDAEFSSDRVTRLARDEDGHLWIGTGAHGLFEYDRELKLVRRYGIQDGLSDNTVTELLPDTSGRIWIGTLRGGLNLLERAGPRVTHFRSSPAVTGSLWSDRINALCTDGTGQLWIGTTDGLNILEIASGQVRRVDLSSNNRHSVRAIMAGPPSADETSARTMWVGASELGLLKFSGGTATLVDPSGDAGRSLSSIRVLYADPVASTGPHMLAWIGGRHGIIKMLVSRNPFSGHVRNRESLQLNRGAVLSLREDREGILWVGLWGGGLNGLRREGGTYRRIMNFENRIGAPPILPGNDIGSLAEDADGTLWIGAKTGLVSLDARRSRFTVYTHVDGDSTSLAGNDITNVYVDRSGKVWIASTAGLSLLLPGVGPRFRNFLHEPSDAHTEGRNEVSDIIEDRRSNIWVSTYGRGINRFAPDGTITRFTDSGDASGIYQNFVYTLTEDHSGLIWLSTPRGLASFDPDSGEFLDHPIVELHNAHIYGIEPDRLGNLWLATGIGLVRYHSATRAFARYDERHGMPFEELFSGFSRNRRGALMSGGADGFVEFVPERVFTDSLRPAIAITGFTVLEREHPIPSPSSASILLRHDENFFSFSFAALDYRNPALNRFAYRLDGVDGQWVDAGPRNFASYTHLDPGEYVFRVKGCNSENVWNEEGTSIAITIAPPFWQTAWFRLGASLLIGGVMYAGFRYRLRRSLEVERLRLRIADDLHDDVGSNLSTIALASRSAGRSPGLDDATKRKLAEIYETAIHTSEGMKDIVWFIKPRSDTLDDLLVRMREATATLLAGVEHEFRAPGVDGAAKISVEFKRNFYLAFKEMLTNVVKHSSATIVVVDVRQTDGRLGLTIRDDGVGFDPAQGDQRTNRRGNGLGSLMRRANAIGGACEIESSPGAGTTVKFTGAL